MQQSTQTTYFQWAFLFGIALLTILLDQITKSIVVAELDLYDIWIPIPALKDVLHITYTRNTGAAFGILPFASPFFMTVAVIASIVIVYYYRHLDRGAWLMRLAMGLQLGGANGNAVDRLTRGYVVDFVHVFYKDVFDYPVFNVADSAIVIGVVLLIILLWREDHKAKKSEAEPGAPPPEKLVFPEE